jgi:elongation factor Ts
MAVTMADISHLRKMSGAGMMDCKKALEEAGNDFDKAMEIIRKKGQAVAAKRSDREASEGCVLAAESAGFAAIVALKCETDFVAKNEQFVALTQDILNVAMSVKPETVEALLASPLADGRAIQEHITDRVGVTGEKMELGFYQFVNGASSVSYIHPGNKLATIVAFNEAVDHTVARDVAMQVAAMNPVAVGGALGVYNPAIDEDNLLYDYLAVLTGLDIYSQIYPLPKAMLNTAKALISAKTLTNVSAAAPTFIV